MADFKYTKNELTMQKGKLAQLNAYLPSLKLKKVLLQKEVNQAREQIFEFERVYETYTLKVSEFAMIYSDWHSSSLEESLVVKKKVLEYENIAGIEVAYLEKLEFFDSERLIYSESVWVQSGIWQLRRLKEHYVRLMVAKEKKRALQDELRIISIRINLFEKILVPKIENIINKIRVFLQDQELQMIGQAKMAKKKLMQKGCLA